MFDLKKSRHVFFPEPAYHLKVKKKKTLFHILKKAINKGNVHVHCTFASDFIIRFFASIFLIDMIIKFMQTSLHYMIFFYKKRIISCFFFKVILLELSNGVSIDSSLCSSSKLDWLSKHFDKFINFLFLINFTYHHDYEKYFRI